MGFVKQKWTIVFAAVALIAIVGAYAYVASLPTPEQIAKKKAEEEFAARQKEFQRTLTWVQSQNPTVIGIPVKDTGNRIILKDTYDALVRYELGGLDLKPCLATKWEISSDGKVYTFYLRKGVKFYPSGDPFNAASAKWTLDTTLGPETAIMSSAYLFGHPKALQYDRCEIVDDYTVKVYLKQPLSWFMCAMAYITVGGQMNPKFVNAHGGWPKSEATIDPYLIWHQDTTAAYAVEEFKPADRVILKRNPTHWMGWEGEMAKRPERIVIRLVPEEATRMMLIARGDADIAEITLPYLPELKSRIASENLPLVIDDSPSLNLRYLILDHKNPPTNDVQIRRALAWTFPYDQFVEKILYGMGDRMSSLTPKGMWGHDPTTPRYELDLEKAKAELAKADPKNVEMLKQGIKLVYSPGQAIGKEGLLLWKTELAKIGVNLVLEEVARAAYRDVYMTTGGVPIVDRSWNPDFADPGTYYQLMSQAHGQSRTFGTTPNSIDDLIAKASLETDPNARLKIYRQIDEWAFENVPHIKVASLKGAVNYNVRGAWVKGYMPNVLQPYKPLFYELWKELPVEKGKGAASGLFLMMTRSTRDILDG